MANLRSPGVLVKAPSYVEYTRSNIIKSYPIIKSQPFNSAITLNIKPLSSNSTIYVFENNSVFLISDNFGIYFDSDGDLLNSVKITKLPENGVIEYFNSTIWAPIQLNQEISVTALLNNHLRYTPVLNVSGNKYTQFSYKVSDGFDYSDSEYVCTVNVTKVETYPSNSIFMVDLNTVISNSNLNLDLSNEVYTSIKSFCNVPYNSSEHTSEILFIASDSNGSSDLLNLKLTMSIDATFTGTFNSPIQFTNYYNAFTNSYYTPHIAINNTSEYRYYSTLDGNGILKVSYDNNITETTDYNKRWVYNVIDSSFYSMGYQEFSKKNSIGEYTSSTVNTSTSAGNYIIANNKFYFFGFIGEARDSIAVTVIDLDTQSTTMLNSAVTFDGISDKYFSYWHELNVSVYGDNIYWSGAGYYDNDNWFQNIAFFVYDIPSNTCKVIYTELDASYYFHMRYVVIDSYIYFITDSDLWRIDITSNLVELVASFTPYVNQNNNQSRRCTSLGVDSANNIICTHFVNNYQSYWSC